MVPLGLILLQPDLGTALVLVPAVVVGAYLALSAGAHSAKSPLIGRARPLLMSRTAQNSRPESATLAIFIYSSAYSQREQVMTIVSKKRR